MFMSKYTMLQENLERLKLTRFAEILPSFLDSNSEKPLVESLLDLTKAEIEFRENRAKKINITISSFPYEKTISDFDFTYQPSINKNQIQSLSSLGFMEEKSNIVFVGPPGTGKTHLATAIGIEAATSRVSTYFINFATLMEKLKIASAENRIEKVVKHYLKYSLLIIDEIGYLPVDRDASYGFFQLIAARYENRSTIFTTNQPFSKWAEVFGDAVITNAIIDRIIHHCTVIKINGMSYRLKGKQIFDEEQKPTF